MKLTTLFTTMAASAVLSAQAIALLPAPAPVIVPGGFDQEIIVQNTGSTPIPGPIGVFVSKLDSRAYIENRNHIAKSPLGGLAYVMVLDAGPDKILSPGETARTTARTRMTNPADPVSLLFTSSQGPYQLSSVQYPYKLVERNGEVLSIFTSVQYPYEVVATSPDTASYDGTTASVVSHNRNSGEFRVRTNLSTQSIPAFVNPASFQDPFIGQFTGNSRADLAVFNRTTGQLAIRDSATGTVSIRENPPFARLNPSAGNLFFAPADYDRDGLVDLAIYSQTTATLQIVGSRDGAVASVQVGTPGSSVPAYSDTDADTYGNFTAFDKSTGRLFTRSLGASISNYDDDTIIVGEPGLDPGADDDQIASGDLDGDGLQDLIITSLSRNQITIRHSATGQITSRPLNALSNSQLLGGQMTFAQWAAAPPSAPYRDADADTWLQAGRINAGIVDKVAIAIGHASAAERIVTGGFTRMR